MTVSNYDFLTVEDYNSIVLNYGGGFFEDYVLDFSKLSSLTLNKYYIVDGFVWVKRTASDNYTIVVDSVLFTGTYFLDSNKGAISVINQSTGYLKANVVVASGFSNDCELILRLSGESYCQYTSNVLHTIDGLSAFVLPYGESGSSVLTVNGLDGSTTGVLKCYDENNTQVGHTANIGVDGKVTLSVPYDFHENVLYLKFEYSDNTVDFACINIRHVKSKVSPVLSGTRFFKGTVNTLKCTFPLNMESVPISLEYGITSVVGVADDDVVTFDIDLNGYREDTLDFKIIIGENVLIYSQVFNYSYQVLNNIAESWSELKTIIEAGASDVIFTGGTFNEETINLQNDVNITMQGTLSSNNEMNENYLFNLGNYNLTLKNWICYDIRRLAKTNRKQDNSILTLDNNSFINESDNISDNTLLVNYPRINVRATNSYFENPAFADYLFDLKGTQLFENCEFKGKTLQMINAVVQFNYCNFTTYSFGYESMWDIINIINGIINGVNWYYLSVGKPFNMGTNHSDINITSSAHKVTGIDGMIYKVRDEIKYYNCTVEDR